MADESEMKRIFGAFYGQLVGDALGSRYEFMRSAAAKAKLQNDLVDGHLPMLGGGMFRKHPGQFTDDSEMALSLAESLLNCKGFNQADVASAYASWYATNPPDSGMATGAALSIPALLTKKSENVLTNKKKILEMTISQAQTFNSNSLSNGPLMRISPLAIALRNLKENELTEIVKQEVQITHSHETIIQASQFYVKLMGNLLKGQQLKEAITNAKHFVKDQLILNIISDSEQCATPVKLSDGRTIDGDKAHMGYFGVALQVALYELQTSDSFEKSLIRIMEVGGDTDTNGCIGAALLGAHFGMDNIPNDWIQTVLNAPIDRDFSFMKPLKEKKVNEFVEELANLS